MNGGLTGKATNSLVRLLVTHCPGVQAELNEPRRKAEILSMGQVASSPKIGRLRRYV